MRAPRRVLFVCADNAGASQIAEAWLRRLGGDRFVARSAGARPRALHPLATRAMQEAGIDIGAQRGKGLDAIRRERFDVLVTLGEEARAATSSLPGSPRTIHHDPSGGVPLEEEDADELEEFRRLRDALRVFVEELIATER